MFSIDSFSLSPGPGICSCDGPRRGEQTGHIHLERSKQTKAKNTDVSISNTQSPLHCIQDPRCPSFWAFYDLTGHQPWYFPWDHDVECKYVWEGLVSNFFPNFPRTFPSSSLATVTMGGQFLPCSSRSTDNPSRDISKDIFYRQVHSGSSRDICFPCVPDEDVLTLSFEKWQASNGCRCQSLSQEVRLDYTTECFEGWRNGLVVKRWYCNSWGPDFSS